MPKSAYKQDDQQRCGAKAAQRREIDGAVEKNHSLRQRGHDFGGLTRGHSAQNSKAINCSLEPIDQNIEKRRHGTEHERGRRRMRDCHIKVIEQGGAFGHVRDSQAVQL